MCEMVVETPRKSLVEKILEETFIQLETLEEFTLDSVQKLREVAKRGDLRKYQRIIEALKTNLGETDEAA